MNVTYPTITKDPKGNYFITFYLNQKRHRLYSSKKIGGHNPIEISNYDCVLFFGPEMFNFNQIKEIILKKKAGFEVNNHEDLTKKIILILDNKKLKEQTIINFKKLCKEEALKVKKVLKNFSM